MNKSDDINHKCQI